MLFKSCLFKIQSNCFKTRSISFKTQHDVNKSEFYSNINDKTAVLCNLLVVYNFCCLGCGPNYIRKTEKKLYERTVEHNWTHNNHAVYKHPNEWTGLQHLFDIASLYSSLFTSSTPIQNWQIWFKNSTH